MSNCFAQSRKNFCGSSKAVLIFSTLHKSSSSASFLCYFTFELINVYIAQQRYKQKSLWNSTGDLCPFRRVPLLRSSSLQPVIQPCKDFHSLSTAVRFPQKSLRNFVKSLVKICVSVSNGSLHPGIFLASQKDRSSLCKSVLIFLHVVCNYLSVD